MITVLNSPLPDITGQALLPRCPLPLLDGRLFAGYMFGTAYYGAGKLVGASGDDLTGKGRSATIAAGLMSTNINTGSTNRYAQLPFSGYDLFGISGESTIIAVTTALAASFSVIVSNQRNNSPVGTSNELLFGSGTGDIRAYNHPPGDHVATSTGTPARSPSVFEFIAATYSKTGIMVYRRKAGMSAGQTAFYTANPATATSVENYRVGPAIAQDSATGDANTAAVMFATKALSVASLDQAYAEMSGLLVDLGQAAL